MSEIYDVKDFHEKFKLPIGERVKCMSNDDALLRIDMYLEEIIEFQRANRRGDVAETADAVIDLVYFALGTAVQMGLTNIWGELWDEVQRANMTKHAVPKGKNSKRGLDGGFDVGKPEGWKPPDLTAILCTCQYCDSANPCYDDCVGACLLHGETP